MFKTKRQVEKLLDKFGHLMTLFPWSIRVYNMKNVVDSLQQL